MRPLKRYGWWKIISEKAVGIKMLIATAMALYQMEMVGGIRTVLQSPRF